MKQQDDRFAKAYGFAVVNGKYREAITLCRQIIETDPKHHMARMLLANLLDDHGNESEVAEIRKHYLEAIRRSTTFDKYWEAWYEEDPIHNLAVWEKRHGSEDTAKLLFTLDKLFIKTLRSLHSPKKSSATSPKRRASRLKTHSPTDAGDLSHAQSVKDGKRPSSGDGDRSAGAETVYTVRPEDDVYAIAIRFGVIPSVLRAANNLSSSAVTPGQKLIIPR